MKRLDRFSDRIIDPQIVLSYEKLDQVVEFKMRVNNKMIFIKERSDDVFKSIDLAIDNIERQVARIKEKFSEHDNKKIVDMVE